MKCQRLFSGENKTAKKKTQKTHKNIINLSAKFAQRVVKAKPQSIGRSVKSKNQDSNT